MVVELIIGEEGFAGGDEAAPIIDYQYRDVVAKVSCHVALLHHLPANILGFFGGIFFFFFW